MDRGFIPPESDERDWTASEEDFLGEFGERLDARRESDEEEAGFVGDEEESGEIRPY